MRIVFVTPVVPGPAYGRRPYNFIKTLSQQHETYLLSASSSPPREDELATLRDFGVREIEVVDHPNWKGALSAGQAFFRGWPLRSAYSESKRLQQRLRILLERHSIDLVHIDRLRLARMAMHVPKAVKCVVDFTDSLALYFERQRAYVRSPLGKLVCAWERRKIPGFERSMASFFDACLLCSRLDADKVRLSVPARKVHVIPNMVDTREFVVRTHPGRPRLIFTGTMTYFPNRDSLFFFVSKILPLVRRRVPEVETLVIGARPDRKVYSLDGQDGIRVVGPVADMAQNLFSNDVFVCPLRVGAGVRNKLLEAMAAGMASVSSRLGAEGIDVEDGTHLLLADRPDESAESLSKLLLDDSLRSTIGANARQLVLDKYSLETVSKQVEDLYQNLPLLRDQPD